MTTTPLFPHLPEEKTQEQGHELGQGGQEANSYQPLSQCLSHKQLLTELPWLLLKGLPHR